MFAEMRLTLEVSDDLPGTLRADSDVCFANLAVQFVFIVLRIKWASDEGASPMYSHELRLSHDFACSALKSTTLAWRTRVQ